MLKFLVVIFGAMLILGTVSITGAKYDFVSNLKEGYTINWNWQEVAKRQIPATHCSGELEYPRDYACLDPYGSLYLPDGLQVEVRDNVGPPKIIMDTGLYNVSIYRATCEGRALIIVSQACGLFGKNAKKGE